MEMNSSNITFVSKNGMEQGKTSADTMMDRIENVLYTEPLSFTFRASTSLPRIASYL
ncbi:hypothetical protein [Gramella sp. MAR_2010_147]|uniref:hypothetical protein n=1 Tax=Gramella sp. MAR_2010_147 TaxID=1250205 RepID=UPI001560F05B|nr:hypothetical protein [Gramella sp. MAR_2010_147]